MVTVTNTDDSDFLNGQAGFGVATIDLGAPGTSITSTIPPNTYAGGTNWTGTSMASPHVAGAIALMYSVQCGQFIANCKANPATMALTIKDSLLNSTDPNADLAGITVSGGRLNLYKAVNSIQKYCVAVTDVPEINSPHPDLFIKNIYPNPADDMLNIVYHSYEPIDIIFTNVLGQEIKRIKGEPSNKGIQQRSLDLNSIAEGIYFVNLLSSNNKSNVVKVFINR